MNLKTKMVDPVFVLFKLIMSEGGKMFLSNVISTFPLMLTSVFLICAGSCYFGVCTFFSGLICTPANVEDCCMLPALFEEVLLMLLSVVSFKLVSLSVTGELVSAVSDVLLLSDYSNVLFLSLIEASGISIYD